MGPVVHSISANSGDSVGVRQSTALSGGVRPERALVFLARARQDNGSEGGKGTTIYTTSLNAVEAASAFLRLGREPDAPWVRSTGPHGGR
jgi:hypothetical protein